MAYVTRCPYCGSVWLVPDKETADRTPLKCPDCRHSFDATCSLLKVPDELFPGRTAVPLFPTGTAVRRTPPVTPSDIPTAPAIHPTAAVAPVVPEPPAAPPQDTLEAAVFVPRPVRVEPTPAAEEPAAPEEPPVATEPSVPNATVTPSVAPITPEIPAAPAAEADLSYDTAAPTFEAMPAAAPVDVPADVPPAAPMPAPVEPEITPEAATPAASEEPPVPPTETPAVADPVPTPQETAAAPATPSPLPTAPQPEAPQRPADTARLSPVMTSKVLGGASKDAATALSLMQTPNLASEPRLGNLSGLKKVVAESEKTAPTHSPRVTASPLPVTPRSSAPQRPHARSMKKKGSAASLILVLVLFLIIGAAAAVVFNQKVMEVLPQTAPYYNNVCRSVPCPGFYLHDINAFAVSKTQLRPLDESGNYSLEVVVLNGSDTAQAVPYLQIELVDDNDGSLLRRTLAPEEYLDKNQKLTAIAPQGQLTVRINLQTNVTSARRIVTPLYP